MIEPITRQLGVYYDIYMYIYIYIYIYTANAVSNGVLYIYIYIYIYTATAVSKDHHACMVILAVDASGVGGVIGRSLWRLHAWCVGWMLDWAIASLHHAHADLFIAAVPLESCWSLVYIESS